MSKESTATPTRECATDNDDANDKDNAMLTPAQQQTQQRDRDLTDYLYTALRELPNAIYQLEADQAVLVNVKREAEHRLDDAELTAQMSAEVKGTNDAARKLELKAAISKHPDYKKAKMEVIQAENEIEMNEAEAKSKRREFQAAIALAELHAARINLMSKINHTKEATK